MNSSQRDSLFQYLRSNNVPLVDALEDALADQRPNEFMYIVKGHPEGTEILRGQMGPQIRQWDLTHTHIRTD
jgi:hypothetical protein